MDELELIESMIQQLREMREKVPEYTQLTPRQIRGLVRVAHLNEEFMISGINAAGAEPRIENAIQWTYAELLQEMGYVKRWSAVESELHATLKGVAAANLTRRYRLGLAILQIYGMLEQLARDPDNAHLLPTLEQMRRVNRIGGKRRKTPEPEPEPEPPQDEPAEPAP